jgi:hypothetical protein
LCACVGRSSKEYEDASHALDWGKRKFGKLENKKRKLEKERLLSYGNTQQRGRGPLAATGEHRHGTARRGPHDPIIQKPGI